jgi:hypothetical protein
MEEDMPLGFGYDPCDECIHWLRWISEKKGKKP